jgi:hypothetical protein
MVKKHSARGGELLRNPEFPFCLVIATVPVHDELDDESGMKEAGARTSLNF